MSEKELQARIDELEAQLEQCTKLLDRGWEASMSCNGYLQVAGHLRNILTRNIELEADPAQDKVYLDDAREQIAALQAKLAEAKSKKYISLSHAREKALFEIEVSKFGDTKAQIAALEAELSQHEKCVYDPDDHGTMTTGCNHISGIPNNSQRFCTFCGNPIRFSWEKTPMGTKPRHAPEKIDIEMTDAEHDKFWAKSAEKCKCPACSEMRTETEANDGECGHCNYHLVPDTEGGE